MSNQPDLGIDPETDISTEPALSPVADVTPSVGAETITSSGTGATPSGARIAVVLEGDDSISIDLAGVLDDNAGRELLEILNRSVVDGVQRVAIDLRGVDDVTEEGAVALAECRSLGPRFSNGLHYRSDSGPGRVALMAALADLSADDDLA